MINTKDPQRVSSLSLNRLASSAQWAGNPQSVREGQHRRNHVYSVRGSWLGWHQLFTLNLRSRALPRGLPETWSPCQWRSRTAVYVNNGGGRLLWLLTPCMLIKCWQWISLKLHFEKLGLCSLKLFTENIYSNVIILTFVFDWFQSQGCLEENLIKQWKNQQPQTSNFLSMNHTAWTVSVGH